MKNRFHTYLQTPLGSIEISGTNTVITSVEFVADEEEPSETIPDILLECKRELEEYFAGKRKEFLPHSNDVIKKKRS